jgi:hypothetical protein
LNENTDQDVFAEKWSDLALVSSAHMEIHEVARMP